MIINLYTINIFTPLQKLPKNVGDLSRLIVAKGFAKLPKVQLIAQYGHTGSHKHIPNENQMFSQGHILSSKTW